MTIPRLLDKDKTKVRLASRKAVERYFVRQAAGAPNTNWLDPANRYRISATKTYESDLRAASVLEAELIDYISATAPAHLIDGWSYLGRATDAILRGDLSAAIHFGYYAELRAAMSLLASEGIGVFNTKHPIISKLGTSTEPIRNLNGDWNKVKKTYEKQKANTHKTVWPLLHHWSSLKRASDLIEELVAPGGYSLRQWLDALNIPSSVKAISKQWLTCWGTDLTRLNDDHDSRNMASYRPSELRLPAAPLAPDAIEFVTDLWRLLEPAAGGKFPQLEKELLKRVILSSGKQFAAVQLENNLGMSSPIADGWQNFFASPAGSKPLLLSDKSSDVDQTDCSFQVVSRAALLLFLATGSTRKHLIDAGFGADRLDFFWRRLCEVRFDGPAASLTEEPIDLWSDIETNIADADLWRSVPANAGASLGEWRKAQPAVMNQIVSLELAAVWGLVA